MLKEGGGHQKLPTGRATFAAPSAPSLFGSAFQTARPPFHTRDSPIPFIHYQVLKYLEYKMTNREEYHLPTVGSDQIINRC